MGTVRNGIQVARARTKGGLGTTGRFRMWLCTAPLVWTAVMQGRRCGLRRLRAAVREEEGQGTTEYAILVGVLVVIAILAIAMFRDRIQSLWDSIASAINGL